MDNIEIKQILADRKIPKSTVAELAGIFPSELSAYLRSERLVTTDKATRIHQALDDVMLAQDAVEGIARATKLPISLNLRDTLSLKKFVEKCREIHELQIAAQG